MEVQPSNEITPKRARRVRRYASDEERRAAKAESMRRYRDQNPEKTREQRERDRVREKTRTKRGALPRVGNTQRFRVLPTGPGLSASERQALISAAPHELGDHVVALADGPAAVVRRDGFGVRVVSAGRDVSEALRRLQRVPVGAAYARGVGVVDPDAAAIQALLGR